MIPKIAHLIYFIFLVISQNVGQQTEIVLLNQNIKKVVNNNSFYRFVSSKQINKNVRSKGEKQQKQNKCGHSSYTPPRQEQKQEEQQFGAEINVIHGHLVPNATNLPWMALLFYQNDGQLWRYCTMTIISERFLLTAGHCIVDAYQDSPKFNSTGPWPPIDTNRYSILAGVITSENGTADHGNGQQIWRRSKRIYPHPNFEYTDYGWKLNYNDIAIIELDVCLEFNERIQPICLPSSNKSASFNKGDEAIVAGWGFVVRDPENSTNLLHDGYVYGLAWEDCKKEDPKFDSTKAICAGGNSKEEGDPCKGDSGGPLMKKQAPDQWTQIGVISGSFGPYCRAPDIMTRINEYCKWIEQITNINCMND